MTTHRVGRRRLLSTLLVAIVLMASPAVWANSARVDVLIVNLNHKPTTNGSSKRIAKVLKKLRKGLRVERVHYSEFNDAMVRRKRPRAVILSPQGDPWWSWSKGQLARLTGVVRALDVPVLGVCGGHQFLALAYGGEVAPISGAKGAATYEGMTREKGPTTVRVVRASPLLADFAVGAGVIVHESHAEEVKRLPPDFDLIAQGTLSPLQAMQHRTKPVYGIQFHAERKWSELPDGKKILRRFLELMGPR